MITDINKDILDRFDIPINMSKYQKLFTFKIYTYLY